MSAAPRFPRLRRAAGCGCLAPPLAWCVLAILLAGGRGWDVGVLRAGAALLFVCVCALAWRLLARRRALGVVAAAGLCCVLFWATRQPTHERAWIAAQSREPRVDVEGSLLHFRDLRDFVWTSDTDAEERWFDATYDLDDLQGVDLVLARMPAAIDLAHVMLTFRFADGLPLTVSAEARFEEGEHYMALPGLFRQYELLYVVGAERDLVQLRTNHRRVRTLLHPLALDLSDARALLLELARRVERLAAEPRFYDTASANCTYRLLDAWAAATGRSLPLDRRKFFNGQVDALLFELGALEGAGTLESLRRARTINARAEAAANAPDFSARIR